MHEDFKAFSQKPTQKFHNNFINLENPKKISKTQKLWLKIMKSMNIRDLETYQVKKNLIKAKTLFEMKFGVWERGLEGEKARQIEKMKTRSRWTNI